MKKNIRFFLKLLFFTLILSSFFYLLVEFILNTPAKTSQRITSYQQSTTAPRKILNAHEHIESLKQAELYLEVARKKNIGKTILLGSPRTTFNDRATGFDGEEENNEEILKILEAYPSEFIVFPTIDAKDPKKLEKLKDYVRRGAQGLKLYTGHRIFHELKLDDATMLPVYRFCQDNNLPIMFHVNAGYYLKEFENVLRLYPDLKIICPHFCLSSIALERFEYLMDTYEQLYTDISFGDIIYLKDALMRISKNPQKYRRLVDKYQDRVLFATDMMVSKAAFKDQEWLEGMVQSYRDMLEKDVYTFFAIQNEDLKGLALDESILKKIYYLNFENFFEKKIES